MTSNMGSQIIQDKFENLKGSVKPQPKLQSRSIGIIETNGSSNSLTVLTKLWCLPLTNENITKIVGLQLKSVTKCSASRHHYGRYSEAIAYLAEKDTIRNGARPVKRVIQRIYSMNYQRNSIWKNNNRQHCLDRCVWWKLVLEIKQSWFLKTRNI
jgi:ATP-dependent Clp protease ATP-binding subunit ClpB